MEVTLNPCRCGGTAVFAKGGVQDMNATLETTFVRCAQCEMRSAEVGIWEISSLEGRQSAAAEAWNRVMTPNHFNGLSPALAERLAILSEECGEIVQVIGKIQRHGIESRHPDGGPTNRQLLEKELGDAYATLLPLTRAGDVAPERIATHKDATLRNVQQWLHHQLAELFETKASK